MQPLVLLLRYSTMTVNDAIEEPAPVTRGRCSPTRGPDDHRACAPPVQGADNAGVDLETVAGLALDLDDAGDLVSRQRRLSGHDREGLAVQRVPRWPRR